MITATIHKMGSQKYLNVTNTNLRHGDRVFLKPKGVDVRVLKNVVKKADRKIILIPKGYDEYFGHGTEVYISWQKKARTG